MATCLTAAGEQTEFEGVSLLQGTDRREKEREETHKTTLLLGVWKLENRDCRPNSPDGRIGLYDEVKCSSFKEKKEDPVC